MEYRRLKDIDLLSFKNNRIFAKFMVLNVEVRLQKDQITKYLKLTLCDGSTKIDACKFGATPQEIEQAKIGKVYQGAIDIKEYEKSPNGISLVIYNFEPIQENSSDYAEWSDWVREARDLIQDALNNISNPIYKNIACNIVLSRWQRFATWAAASSMHHDILGGLIVHTAEVTQQAKEIGLNWNQRYGEKFVDIDLVVASALLHDIAKVDELSTDTLSGHVEYTVAASLESHITMCASLIDIEAYKLGYGTASEEKSDEQLLEEKEQISLLKHCILAHHGKKEYGAAIEPHIPEASILHMADVLSAEMFRYKKQFENLDSMDSTTQWAGGQMLTVYKGKNKA